MNLKNKMLATGIIYAIFSVVFIIFASPILIHSFNGGYQFMNKLIIFTMLLILAACGYILLSLVYNKHYNNQLISKNVKYVITITYALIVFGLLFLRAKSNTEFTYSLIPTLDLDLEHFPRHLPSLVFLFNIGIFFPLGLLYDLKYRYVIVGFVILEFLQALSLRGIFDITDIILYTVGFTIGVLFRKMYLKKQK